MKRALLNSLDSNISVGDRCTWNRPPSHWNQLEQLEKYREEKGLSILTRIVISDVGNAMRICESKQKGLKDFQTIVIGCHPSNLLRKMRKLSCWPEKLWATLSVRHNMLRPPGKMPYWSNATLSTVFSTQYSKNFGFFLIA